MIDTAGLEEVTDDSLQGRMRRLTERAVDMADVCLFLIDGRAGVTPTDQVFAEILRKKNARVILGVNKAEGNAGDARRDRSLVAGAGRAGAAVGRAWRGHGRSLPHPAPHRRRVRRRAPTPMRRWWMST